MVLYDVLMLVVLIGCVVFGAWKGMAWQLASLCSLVVSYFVALKFGDQLAPLLGQQEPWNHFLAMFILYLVSSLAIWLGFRVVSGAIDRVKLKEFDRQLGALFGLCKGVALCVVITFFAVTLSSSARDVIVKTRSGYYIGRLLDRAHPLIPDGVHSVLHPYFDELEQKLDANYQPPADGDGPAGTSSLASSPVADALATGPPSTTTDSAFQPNSSLGSLGRILGNVNPFGGGSTSQPAAAAGDSSQTSSLLEPEAVRKLADNLEWLQQIGQASGQSGAAQPSQEDPVQRARELILNSPELRKIVEDLQPSAASQDGPATASRPIPAPRY